MTIDEARKLIPPGWVECDESDYLNACTGRNGRIGIGYTHGYIYAIPAPKPEPRRVPCGEIVIEFTDDGCKGVLVNLGQVANEGDKWRLDFDTREWVEVVE